MSSEPLIDHIPIMKREQDGAIITQFDYPTCETLGLLKMDFLGLRNLTVIDDAIHNIKINRGIDVEVADLPLDDAETYRMLAHGDTLGVFQLDGGPLRSLLRQMSPTGFEDISAVIALYRPGPWRPMRTSTTPTARTAASRSSPSTPSSPSRWQRSSTRPTDWSSTRNRYMAIARKVAGYTLGQADLLRRAMGKKKKAVLDAQLENFTAGHAGERLLRGRDQGAVGHPAAVLRLRLQQVAHRRLRDWCRTGRPTSRRTIPPSTWPRCSPPCATTRTSRPSISPSAGGWASRSCRRASTSPMPTSPRRARTSGSASPRSATSGRTSSRRSSPRARPRTRSSTSATSCARWMPSSATSGLSKALIKGGAFDSLGHARRGLILVYEAAVDAVLDTKRAEAIGQFDLFGSLGEAGARRRRVRGPGARR